MSLPVIPTDSKDNPIHGLKIEAESNDKKVALVTKDGFIVAGNPGRTDITVRAGNQTLTFSVTVVPAPKIKKDKKQKISSRSSNGVRMMNAVWNPNERLTAQFASTSFAATKAKSAAAFQYGGPPPSYQTTRIYDTGRPALRTENGAAIPAAATGGTERPGSANFNFAVPLVNLAGRGPSASLGLFYNSLLWKKTTSSDYLFDNESWLAPGFRLGYGKILVGETNFYQGSTNPGTLRLFDVIQGDGTHQEFEYDTVVGVFQSKDGSFTRFYGANPYGWHSVSYIGTMVGADGTRIDYGAGIQTAYSQFGANNVYYTRDMEAYPVKITDRSGNYIKINYVGGVGPKIASIEDSLGRYVTFWYAANGDLISITEPGYAGGDDRQVARFYYQDLAITASFQNPGSGTSNPGTKRVLKYIYLPGTKAGWKYDYSSYGMIYQTKQLRGMTCSNPSYPNVADTVSIEGLVAATTTYNYPTTAGNLNDVPQFTQRTDNWAGNTNGAATTTFSSNPGTGTTSVTDPYGVISETKKYTTGDFAGLVQETTVKKSNGEVLAKTVLEYDPNQIWRNFRVNKTTSYITIGNSQTKSKLTEYSYDSYNNITLTIEKDYGGNEVRRTETTYETGTGWINRRLLRLPKTVLVKNAGGTVVSRSDFVYDKADTGVSGANLLARSNAYGCDDIVGHSTAYDPYACAEFWGYINDPNDPDCNDPYCYTYDPYNCDGNCNQIAYYASPYDSGTAYRGNVTKIKRWAKPAATEADPISGNNNWSKKVAYDLEGKVTDTLDARNTNTHFTYDTLNRLSTIAYSGGSPTVATPSVTYVYDEAEASYYNLGRLTEVRTAASSSPVIPATKIQYDYDQMGRLKKHNQIVGSDTYAMQYGYNLAGQLTSQTYPSTRVVNYNYQTGYGLTSVNDASRTYVSGLTYTAHGAMNNETLGNGAVQTMAFNNRLQLSQINLTKSGTELQRYDYSYGQYDATNTTLDATKNNGQIAKIEGFIGGTKQWEQRHTYDEMGRLKVAGEYRGDNGQVSWRAQYGYDRFGNRYQDSSMSLNTGLLYVAVQSADFNRTTNRFANGISYDDGGNVLTDSKFKASTSYGYDANNRVVSTNGGATTAVYDAAGQRVRATESGITTTSVYDGSEQMIAEYSGATLSREYIGNIATVEGSTVRYLMSDHLGSNRVVMNDTGGVTVRHDYLPFGEELGLLGMRTSGQGYGVADLTRTKFAGMERETANGLDHTLFRKAETRSGRWNSPDPYTGSMFLDAPQSFNRYCYSYNDPQNFVDPNGAIPVPLITAGIGFLAGGLGSIAGQIISNKGFGNFSWKSVGIAAGVGAVAGALAPVSGALWVAGLVGGAANAIQYGLNQRFGGAVPQSRTYSGYLYNFAVGAVTGGVFGRWTTPNTPWGAGLPGARYAEGNAVLQQLNIEASQAANVSVNALVRSSTVNGVTNALPPEVPTLPRASMIPPSSNIVGWDGKTGAFQNGNPFQFDWLERVLHPTVPTVQAVFDCTYKDTPSGIQIVKCVTRFITKR